MEVVLLSLLYLYPLHGILNIEKLITIRNKSNDFVVSSVLVLNL